MTQHLDIVLPIAVLLLSFLLKLFLDRIVDMPLFIRSIYELPVDIMFLTISFTVAYTITSNGKLKNNGLLYCFIFIIISIFNVLIWRKSVKLFESNSMILSIFITGFNFFITIYCLHVSILFLSK